MWMQKQPPTQRHLDMKAAYDSGLSLQAVGNQYGITRERVRQILKRNFGHAIHMPRADGKPRAIGVSAKDKTLREERYMKVYGMTVDVRQKHLDEYGRWPYRAYSIQKAAARQRGIDWKFTFADWFDFWIESGHWPERGLHGYVMTRIGDDGPYSRENCRIATNGDNIREYHSLSRLTACQVGKILVAGQDA